MARDNHQALLDHIQRVDQYAGEVTCYNPKVGFIWVHRVGSQWWVTGETEEFPTFSQSEAVRLAQCWDKWGVCPVPKNRRRPVDRSRSA